VKIGTRTRYGLRTLIEIARTESAKGVFQKDIALSQSLSNKYLDHIIHALKTSGIITNVKGKKSGYLLSRPPEQISVFDIHQAFEPEVCLVECLSPTYQCNRNEHCRAQGFWKGLNLLIINYLKSVSVADLMNQPMLAEDLVGKFSSGFKEQESHPSRNIPTN